MLTGGVRLQFLMGTKFTLTWLATRVRDFFIRPRATIESLRSPSRSKGTSGGSNANSDAANSPFGESNIPPPTPPRPPSPPPVFDLSNAVKLYIDDQQISIQGLASVVLLNIPGFGGGAQLRFPPVSMSDGMLDVLAFRNSVHLATSMVGLTEPVLLGRAKEVRIVVEKEVAVQVDGEPSVCPAGTVSIKLGGRAVMLKREEEDDGYTTDYSVDTEGTGSTVEIGVPGLAALPIPGLGLGLGLRRRVL